MHGKFIWIFPSHLFYLKRCCTNNLNHHDIWLISEYTKSRRWLSVWLQFQLIKCMRLKHTFYILSKRRWSSRRFPYGYLVTTSPSLKNLDSNATTITSSSKPFLGGVTGGVCKEQGRIHRAIVIRDYYAFQLHENELQSSIRTTTKFRGLPPPFGVGTHCLSHCSPRVAQRIRGIRTYRRPLLPPIYHRRSP